MSSGLTLIYTAVGLFDSDSHIFEWPYLLKFLCTKIVKQFVFLVQVLSLYLCFLNLWNNKFLSNFFKFWNWVSYMNSGGHVTEGFKQGLEKTQKISCISKKETNKLKCCIFVTYKRLF